MTRVLLLVMLAMVGVSWARIVCTPDFCDRVRCAGVSQAQCEADGKDFRPHSTTCGCCDRCIDFLADGDTCGIKPSLPIIVVGGPPILQPKCRPASECVNHVCNPRVTF